jgi:hypothetical protein
MLTWHLMQEAVVPSKHHKRSQTVLDGSQAQQPQQPTTQPNTPVKRSLWGSRAAPLPEEPAGPSPYADCDPFDVTMMRCSGLSLDTTSGTMLCKCPDAAPDCMYPRTYVWAEIISNSLLPLSDALVV